MPRARDLGLPFPGTPGPLNAIKDVADVTVGFETLLDPIRHIRTGVTAIIPRRDAGNPQPVRAGQATLNGNGEMTGTHWIADGGYFLGPILITNTHGIGACHTGATRWMIDRYEAHFRDTIAWAMPVVAETYDGILNDINAMPVQPEHALAALHSATSGPVAEGAVGGGTGMIAYEFKAGTGTSSRQVVIGTATYTVGVLVQANHGKRPWLNILGKAVGRIMPFEGLVTKETGSIIVVIATDAPLSNISLNHLARRASLGIGRGGTPGGNSSGDIFLAFSTAPFGAMPQQAGVLIQRSEMNAELIDLIYLAAVEAVEESIVNAITAGTDTPTFRFPGKTIPGINTNALAALSREERP